MLWIGLSGIHTPTEGETFSCSPKRPYHLWGPPRILFIGHRGSFPGVKRPRRGAVPSAQSSAEFKHKWSFASPPPLQNFTTFVVITFTWMASSLGRTLYRLGNNELDRMLQETGMNWILVLSYHRTGGTTQSWHQPLHIYKIYKILHIKTLIFRRLMSTIVVVPHR